MNPITNLHQGQNKVIVSMGYDSITTSVTLIPGHGTILPDVSTSYNLVWWNASDYLNPTDDPSVEIVKCIAKFGDMLIVMRSQQQTLASPKNIPGKLYNMAYLPDTLHDSNLDTNLNTNLETLSYYNVPQMHGISAHTGTIGTWANIDKTTSSIVDITTRNHTLLTDIGTNTHTTIDAAILNSTTHIAAAAPHSGHDTPAQRDTAITNHTNLVTGVHGVTGSYILGTEDMGVANGVASLDASGKVLTSQLPGLAITSVYTAINQAAQLALTTQEGDVVVRSDENKSYVRNAGLTGTMADYTQLLTPTDVVTSVFGRTGVVTQAINDYTWAQINKATSNIADIITRSHTSLTDIGTNTHAQIDTAINTTLPGLVTSHSGLTTAHGSSGTVLGLTTADGRYAPIANGVTNGNAHDHSGGDGAQINHTTLSNIGTNTHAQIDSYIATPDIFTKGGNIMNSAGIPNAALNTIIWITPFACTITAVKGYRIGGTGAVINARKNGSLTHLSANLSLTSVDAWMDGGAVQNTAYATNDKLEIIVVSTAGVVTQLGIQVNFTRP